MLKQGIIVIVVLPAEPARQAWRLEYGLLEVDTVCWQAAVYATLTALCEQGFRHALVTQIAMQGALGKAHHGCIGSQRTLKTDMALIQQKCCPQAFSHPSANGSVWLTAGSKNVESLPAHWVALKSTLSHGPLSVA